MRRTIQRSPTFLEGLAPERGTEDDADGEHDGAANAVLEGPGGEVDDGADGGGDGEDEVAGGGGDVDGEVQDVDQRGRA